METYRDPEPAETLRRIREERKDGFERHHHRAGYLIFSMLFRSLGGSLVGMSLPAKNSNIT
jgi:hypothetical protein